MKQSQYWPSSLVGITAGGVFDLYLFGSGLSAVAIPHGHGSGLLYDIFSSPYSCAFYIRPFAYLFLCIRSERWIWVGILIILIQLVSGTNVFLETRALNEVFVDDYQNNRVRFNQTIQDLIVYYLGHIAGLVFGIFGITTLRKLNRNSTTPVGRSKN